MLKMEKNGKKYYFCNCHVMATLWMTLMFGENFILILHNITFRNLCMIIDFGNNRKVSPYDPKKVRKVSNL